MSAISVDGSEGNEGKSVSAVPRLAKKQGAGPFQSADPSGLTTV